MKKLMIAAAIVCAAAFANAAVFTWGGDLALMDNNNVNANGTVEFFLDGASLGAAVEITDGMASFNYDLDSWGTVSAVATITNFSDGEGTRTWSQAIDATWLAGYPDANQAASDLAMSINMDLLNGEGLDFTKTAAANGYTAVPEPTSGLLLLLGMAGLALRRRRA